MTSGAVWFVGSKLPDYRLAVARVATGTYHAESMISRVVGRGVVEIYSQPIGGVVAFVTLQGGHKMSGGFSCRGGSIVAGGTTPRHQTMIHGSRRPGQSIVATITLP